jgi:hypothetical protein
MEPTKKGGKSVSVGGRLDGPRFPWLTELVGNGHGIKEHCDGWLILWG